MGLVVRLRNSLECRTLEKKKRTPWTYRVLVRGSERAICESPPWNSTRQARWCHLLAVRKITYIASTSERPLSTRKPCPWGDRECWYPLASAEQHQLLRGIGISASSSSRCALWSLIFHFIHVWMKSRKLGSMKHDMERSSPNGSRLYGQLDTSVWPDLTSMAPIETLPDSVFETPGIKHDTFTRCFPTCSAWQRFDGFRGCGMKNVSKYKQHERLVER